MADFSARIRRAMALQKKVAAACPDGPFPDHVRYVGGADIAFPPADARTPSGRAATVGAPAVGIAIVYDLQEHRVVEARCIRRRLAFPYVPGLLTYREAPILQAAIKRIAHLVDVWMFDGQGRAHPRGAGLATHMGYLLDMPTIGAAKSLLVGQIDIAGTVLLPARPWPVASAPVRHDTREIARALTLYNPKEPMIISPGWRCTLQQAVDVVLRCARGGKLPEPTRIADALSKLAKPLSARAARQLIETRTPNIPLPPPPQR